MNKSLIKQVILTILLLVALYGLSSYSLNNFRSQSPKNKYSSPGIKSATVEEPTVYMTSDISPKGLMDIYNALGREATGKVAVKVHTGEPGGHNFLSPDLIKDLVQSVNGTIVECNTAYGGSRATTAMHRQVAIDHGFAAIANVDIMDADGYISLPVTGGTHLTENFVGTNFNNYDFFVILSHFKGHAMGGFGGAIKNMSIGIAASRGKSWIHSSGTATSGFMGDHNNFLESMAEAASSVANTLGDSIIYINVMNNLSVDCDCMSHPAEPTMADIGILASLDPVALDQACVDLVYAANDGHDLIQRMESLDGIHTLEHAVAIGFGNRAYNLVDINAATRADEMNISNIKIYPNPSQSQITIPNHKQYDEISIFDINGRLVSKHQSKSRINIEELKQGRYIMQFHSSGKQVGTSSLIKE